jgi:signal transduction histidine kinase
LKIIFRFTSLRRKILLAIAAVIILCAIVLAFTTNLIIELQMSGRYSAEKEAVIESLTYSLGPALVSSDSKEIEQVISSYLIFENVSYVAVFDTSGTQIGRVVQENASPVDYSTEHHDVSNAEKVIGGFDIGFSRQYIDVLVSRTTLVLIISLVVFLVLSGLALSVFIGRSVIRPIEGFARNIRRMNPGNLSVRMPVQSNDEIGILASNFNQMAGELETSLQALQQALENARAARESRDLAVLGERNRMAREIHDTLAQGFAGIILQLEAAEQELGSNTGNVHDHLDRARQLARESLNEARRSVWALRPQALERFSFIASLRQQAEAFSEDTGIQVKLDAPEREINLPGEVEDALLRVFQESLTNIRKHSQATGVAARLTFENKAVQLKIEDNGIGFDPGQKPLDRFGLISMRERAKLLGGSLRINSEKDKGTQIDVIIPLERGAA